MMKKIKKAFIGFAVCAMTFSSGAFSSDTEVEVIYYETAAKQKVVGAMISGCGNRPMMWGKKTSYYTASASPCFA